ncbi:MAG: hypothetical protein V1823_04360 [Chloroflexota bacterium]
MISGKLQELYDRYSSPDAHLVPEGNFVSCGVVNDEAYDSSSPKLVCVLREPNDKKQSHNWLIPELLRQRIDKGKLGMWRKVGVWSYAIHNGFPEYTAINNRHISAKGLKYIGMTNLKKSGGGGTANYQAVREYATKTIELWKSELEIMNPDVILCCGTFGIVTDLLGLKTFRMDTQRMKRGYLYYAVWKRDAGNSLLLRFYHPASRFEKGVLYGLLKEALVELREKGLWHS